MNLRQLRFFVAVAEELHFGRAAERLNMTQPPLSQAILALEQELGVMLFKRTKRHVELTPVGAHWLNYVNKLLENAEALPVLARQIARGEVGTFTVGFVSTAVYSLLPALVASYRSIFPDVKVNLQEMTSDLQIEALLQGDIDAGLIIPAHATLDASLAYLPLLREPLVAAIPEAWLDEGRLACAEGKLKLSEIADKPLVIFPHRSAPAFHDIITSYFVKAGLRPKFGQEAIQMQTIVSLVSSGIGVALVPETLRRLGRSGIRYVPLEGDPPVIETGLVWRNEDPSPAANMFVNLAKSHDLNGGRNSDVL
ncbi:LysR family transcriptional regulator [Sinorhizobium arboris]|uniref:LysR family transcriptional regulator n=1 Tax=Sinorhizobium arboris TaxID=76745 RepID=UPI0004826B22|nr:LysR family transcriptional regulator [Sinorhizobium arboris]